MRKTQLVGCGYPHPPRTRSRGDEPEFLPLDPSEWGLETTTDKPCRALCFGGDVMSMIDVLLKKMGSRRGHLFVSDIDDTVIRSSDSVRLKFGCTLLEKARTDLDMKIGFVTARVEYPYNDPFFYDNRAHTIGQLAAAGLTSWDALVLNSHYLALSPDFSFFKELARIRLVTDLEVPLAVSVGDTWADLCLQNPFVQHRPRAFAHWLEEQNNASYDPMAYYICCIRDPLLPQDLPYYAVKLPNDNNDEESISLIVE